MLKFASMEVVVESRKLKVKEAEVELTRRSQTRNHMKDKTQSQHT